jgi:hypothetical protein
LRYVKFEIPGFEGTKDLVFIPDTCQMASRLPEIMKLLKLTHPNLLIEGMGDTTHPQGLLTRTELQNPEYKKVLVSHGEHDADLTDEFSQALCHKLDNIFVAVITAAEQTGSWSFGQNFGNKTVLQFYNESMKASPDSFWIWTHHAGCIRLTDVDRQLNKFLFEQSVNFDADGVKAAEPVALSEELAGHFSNWDFNTPYTGLIRKDHPEYETRPEMQSSWCFPHSNVVLMHYRQSEDGGFDSEYVDQDEYRNLLPDRSLIAPPGCIFIGGRTIRVKHLLTKSIQHAIPSILIDHTGGYTRLFSVLVSVLTKIIQSDRAVCKQFLPKGGKVPEGTKERVLAMSCSQLLTYVLETGYGNESDFAFDGSKLALADVRKIVDLAANRPQVITDTIKVVNPVEMSGEDALESLSSCFSSTCTGMVELGSGSANDDVVMEAWRTFWQLHTKGKNLHGTSSWLVRLSTTLAFLAVLAAICHEKLQHCPREEGDKDWQPYCKGAYLPVIWFFGLLTIVVPVLSNVINTVSSHFGHHKKWAAVKMAECQLVQHIYMFRGGVGPYSTDANAPAASDEKSDGHDDEKGDGAPPPGLNKAARARAARDSFVKTVNKIHGDVQRSTLQQDYLGHKKNALSDIKLLLNIEAALYEAFEFTTEQDGGNKANANKAKDNKARDNKARAVKDSGQVRPEALRQTAGEQGESRRRSQRNSISNRPMVPSPRSDDGYDEEMGKDSGSGTGKMSYLKQLYVDPLTAEVYYNTRLHKLLEFSTHLIPDLVQKNDRGHTMTFICGGIASLLGAFGCAGWIPVFMSLSSTINTLRTFNGHDMRTMGLNHSLAGLKTLNTQWKAMSNMDRRTPENRKQLIMKCETLVLEAMKSWTGAAATDADEGGSDNAHKEGDGAKDAKKKDKKKPADDKNKKK